MDFLGYIIKKLPFQIKYVHTENGHELQFKYHWHAEDCGINHRYIRMASPCLNGRMEFSRMMDKQEFINSQITRATWI